MRNDWLVITAALLMSGCQFEYPGTEEVDVDRDCETRSLFYADDDGDGLGDPDHKVLACDAPAGAVENADDCDDTDPDQGETCDSGLDSE
jgi:hypothetical protein